MTRRCFFCHGNRECDTRHEDLGRCCSVCAKHHNNVDKNIKELLCVVCGTIVSQSLSEANLTAINTETISFDDGAATAISYGYGCDLDGDVYIIAICRECTLKAVENKRMIYQYNYIDPCST